MRLICPNCSVEYEVDAALLPSGGRHVVCSACNFTWFEEPASALAREDEPASPAAPIPEGAATVETLSPPARSEGTSVDLPPRTVSGAALDILRQEAEFEARLRAREWDGTTGATDAAQPEPAMPVPAPETMEHEAPKAANLPDKTPANAPTRPDVTRAEPVAMPPPRTAIPRARVVPVPPKPKPRKTVSRWFALPLGLLAFLILVYLLAPGIIVALPEAESAIVAYVQAVDTLRDQALGLVER